MQKLIFFFLSFFTITIQVTQGYKAPQIKRMRIITPATPSIRRNQERSSCFDAFKTCFYDLSRDAQDCLQFSYDEWKRIHHAFSTECTDRLIHQHHR